ncbi:hypothetical protein SAMN06273572_10251 [Monaibacterium marinum]|uniref:Uncharacterized protein n=1 Tax=Pontivivens marinum TaxID=1690039 RepID=A0A2C9CQB9_9RHOB|nr:hypothetical protein [Monaibacterium marinum]SOH93375.1 hypothetical protein SAMN06273572_10251 [Monaibacterium marinum]
MARPDLRTRYHLAYKLKKTLTEIEAMPMAEYVGWLALFEVDAPDG